MSHCARSRAKDLYLVDYLKTKPCSANARAYSPKYAIFYAQCRIRRGNNMNYKNKSNSTRALIGHKTNLHERM